MKWPWHREAEDTGGRRALRAAEARTPHIEWVARELETLRRRNHFAESIELMMKERHA